MIEAARVEALWQETRDYLLSLRSPEGYWEGYLSSSALATATALTALSLAADPSDGTLTGQAAAWLARDQNDDGGWGDSPESPSNLSTTLLCLSALTIAATGDRGEASPPPATATDRAWDYVAAHAGRSAADG